VDRGVTVAIAVVVLLLVGVPLFAWWVGGRRFWTRLKPGPDPCLPRALIREHGLSPDEVLEVERAVTWGKELQDARLRAAVVDWAQRYQAAVLEQRASRSALHDWGLIAFLLWGAAVLAYVVFAVARGRWGDVNWFTAAYWVAIGVLGWRRRTGPARAIERNCGPPSAPAGG
jgi:hypothetical protein